MEIWTVASWQNTDAEAIADSLDWTYRQPFNIWRSLVGNKFADHSDVHVVGASPVGAAPTTSSS